MSQPIWKKFSKEELQQFVAESTSIRQLAQKMGYAVDSGSASKSIKNMIDTYQFDTSHFLGQAHNANKFDYERFAYGSAIKIASALPALVHLRGHKCECCQLDKWQDQEIPLEIHHIDGDHLNNELDNLQILCPNCHALTNNWRGKNMSKKEIIPIEDEVFVEALRSSKNIRQALIQLGLTPAGGNYTRANELIVRYQIDHLLK